MGARDDLISLSDYVSERTLRRPSGLGDVEYFWEPVPGCWSVRIGADGAATADWNGGALYF